MLLVDKDGIIQSTEVGKLIESDRFDSEDFIKQLLQPTQKELKSLGRKNSVTSPSNLS